ncbi:ATP-binding protein [Paenibacillus sp. TRM 82003]|nr:ATP-binding protein [Paenibacillus sp. TRM 82003]
MYYELISHASLLLASLYLCSFLFRKPSTAWSYQLVQGMYLGAVSALLFQVEDASPSTLVPGYYLIPIFIGSVLANVRASFVAAAAVAGWLWLRYPEGFGAWAALETVVSALAVGWIVRVGKGRWTKLAGASVVATLAIGLSVSARDGASWTWDGPSIFGFLVLFVAGEALVRFDLQRRTLVREYTYLTQHDMLTGLLNFQTFQARLQTLLSEQRRVCFVLIDCDDVKSLNTEQGFHSVDGTLKKVANLLRAFFPDALLMGRYGSDEFAVVFPVPDKLSKTLAEVLDTQIPDIADIQLSYGYAVFPDEERDPLSFITLVQKRMLETKRRLWLQREAHWLHNERLKAVGELAAGMAHEIRNPLTTVKGFLQVSKQNKYDIWPYYDIIMHEIKRMSDLTSEFLQFSKPTAHQPTKSSIQECVQAAVQLTESEAVSHGHQLSAHTDAEPLYALLEKDKIIQVLVNLIRNGIDAMGEGSGGGSLAITVYPRGEYGLIDIADTGCGILDEHMDKLFQPFFTTKDKGTGLGLPISQKIINEHGGYISVRSKVGAGTTFTIRLPLQGRAVDQ